MSIEGGFADVMELLSEAAARLEEMESPDAGARSSAALSGDTPAATENRAIHAARMTISRERAREMRADLDRIRTQARQMAEQVRRARARTSDGSSRTTPAAGRDEAGAVEAGHASRFKAVAEALKHTHDLDLVYRVVARGLRDTLPGGAVAGVCRLRPRGADDPGGLEVVAGEPSLVEVVEVENTTGRGPCRDAVAGHGVIDVPQLAEGAPWPEVATEAGQRGWRSVLVCPFVERTDKHRGALVVYSRSANGVGRSGREAVEHLAELAGVSLSGARRIADLLDALQSRDVIGQAKGMLMLRDGLDAEQAFARLVEASQHANIKLRDVAAWLVEAAVVRGDR